MYYIINKKADNFRTSSFTIAIVVYIFLRACSQVVWSICVYVLVYYTYTLSISPIARLLFFCLGHLLGLHPLWLVCYLCLICSVCVCVCCAYVRSSAVLSAPVSAVPVLCWRLLWLVCYLYAWIVCFIYIFSGLFAICALSVWSPSVSAILVLSYSLLYLHLHFLCLTGACVFFLLCQR